MIFTQKQIAYDSRKLSNRAAGNIWMTDFNVTDWWALTMKKTFKHDNQKTQIKANMSRQCDVNIERKKHQNYIFSSTKNLFFFRKLFSKIITSVDRFSATPFCDFWYWKTNKLFLKIILIRCTKNHKEWLYYICITRERGTIIQTPVFTVTRLKRASSILRAYQRWSAMTSD